MFVASVSFLLHAYNFCRKQFKVCFKMQRINKSITMLSLHHASWPDLVYYIAQSYSSLNSIIRTAPEIQTQKEKERRDAEETGKWERSRRRRRRKESRGSGTEGQWEGGQLTGIEEWKRSRARGASRELFKEKQCPFVAADNTFHSTGLAAHWFLWLQPGALLASLSAEIKSTLFSYKL